MDSFNFKDLRETTKIILEAGTKEMHHFTSGIDDSPDEKGHYSKSSTNNLKKAGDAARKAGMKVTYSTASPGVGKGTTNHSSTVNSKHDLVHISHHDPKQVHKVLATAGHVDHDDHEFTNDYLKSKTHGGHSDSTAEYHYHNDGNRT